MASLLDIANVPRVVETSRGPIQVFGIGARSLALLMVRFPDIGKSLSGLAAEEFTTERMIELGPVIVAAAIAAGCGSPGDEIAEEAAASLGAQDQLDLIDEILRLTFPRGVAPFVAKLEGLGLLAQGAIPPQR